MEGQLSLNVSVYPCSWLQRGSGDGDDYLLCGRLHCHPYDHLCLCPQRSPTTSGHCSYDPVLYSRYFISFFHFARSFVRCFVTGKSSVTASWIYLQILTFWIAFVQNCVLCSRHLLTIVSEIICKSVLGRGTLLWRKTKQLSFMKRGVIWHDRYSPPRRSSLFHTSTKSSSMRSGLKLCGTIRRPTISAFRLMHSRDWKHGRLSASGRWFR